MAERRSLPAYYKDTLYRSHLEARWAIFLNELDVKAQYEPQGFDLGDGTAYLPDFAIYAATGTVWAEIKPEWDADLDGVEKWRRFAPMRPSPEKSRAALLIGPPSAETEHVVIGGADEMIWEDGSRTWRPCPSGHHFDLAWAGSFQTKFAEDGCPDYFGADGVLRLEAAVKAALSHRFGKFGSDGKAA